MSIFKAILSPFIEFKESTTPNPASVANAAPVNMPNPANHIPITSSQPATSGTNSTNSFYNFFEHLIEEANQKNPLFQGTDLKEYLDTKVELDSIPDEATKIKTAFNVLKKAGLTKDKLLVTGREYVNLIDHELAAIEQTFAQQYKNEVELKEQQLQAKAQEIEALNTKIESIHQEISQLSQQVSQSKDQLTSNKQQFILAGQNKKSELVNELQKINQYL